MASKEHIGTCRKNKANNHKYLTIPKQSDIEPGDDVVFKKKKKRILNK